MGNAITDLDLRWPAAVVPIDTTLVPGQRQNIERATRFYATHTAFRFVTRTTEDDYILFTATTEHDPAGGAIVEGTWQTLGPHHHLVAIGRNEVLAWNDASGDVRIWKFDVDNDKDPLPDPPRVRNTPSSST